MPKALWTVRTMTGPAPMMLKIAASNETDQGQMSQAGRDAAKDRPVSYDTTAN